MDYCNRIAKKTVVKDYTFSSLQVLTTGELMMERLVPVDHLPHRQLHQPMKTCCHCVTKSVTRAPYFVLLGRTGFSIGHLKRMTKVYITLERRDKDTENRE